MIIKNKIFPPSHKQHKLFLFTTIKKIIYKKLTYHYFSMKNVTLSLRSNISYLAKKVAISNKNINFLCDKDTLTGLYNTVGFQFLMNSRLNSSLPPLKQILIFIELNNLNAITEIIGFSFIDQLLVTLSEHLKKLLLQNHTISNHLIGRLDGPRFALLISCADCIDTLEYLIKDYISHSIINLDLAKSSINIEYNVGIAVYPDHASNSQDLINNCNVALSQARNDKNSNYRLFNQQMLLELTRKNKIINILKTCTQNGELVIYFQPQYIIKNHEIRGFEALARLFSKELGLISPNEFIPLAEESGLILDIGLYLINEVFMTILDFQRKNYNFKLIAINISLLQIIESNFTTNIRNLMQKLGISSQNVEFELTESILINSFDNSLKVLHQLKSLGIILALDDFGTGYSSLNYLSLLPIDVLKIDKSFIDHISDNNKSYNIVKLIIELAHELNLKVICEGVETLEQLDLLNTLGADIAQGYYFKKPLSKANTESLFV